MGTILIPTYATLSMGYFAPTFYTMCINEFGEQFILENWCLFLDGCQTPLDKTKTDLNKLLVIVNFLNHYITFTMEISNKDLLLKKR